MCTGLEFVFLASTAVTAISARKEFDDRAAIEDENAELAEAAARQNAEIERREQDRLRAIQRTAFATSGVLTVGTPEEVLAETAREGELDALTILHSGQLDAKSHRDSASALRRKKKGALLKGIGGGISAFV